VPRGRERAGLGSDVAGLCILFIADALESYD
jgi:hypothetical protein